VTSGPYVSTAVPRIVVAALGRRRGPPAIALYWTRAANGQSAVRARDQNRRVDIASVIALTAQTVILAFSTWIAWQTVKESNKDRERERFDAKRRENEAKIDAVAHRVLDVYEAARARRQQDPAGLLFESAQRRLQHALAIAPGMRIEAVADVSGEPAEGITEELVGRALDEIAEELDELRR
jgi:hypothetical protein